MPCTHNNCVLIIKRCLRIFGGFGCCDCFWFVCLWLVVLLIYSNNQWFKSFRSWNSMIRVCGMHGVSFDCLWNELSWGGWESWYKAFMLSVQLSMWGRIVCNWNISAACCIEAQRAAPQTSKKLHSVNLFIYFLICFHFKLTIDPCRMFFHLSQMLGVIEINVLAIFVVHSTAPHILNCTLNIKTLPWYINIPAYLNKLWRTFFICRTQTRYICWNEVGYTA